MTKTDRRHGGVRAVSTVLFLSLFAAQAGAIALSPVLVDVARDLDVSTAAAGQLRTIAGLVAGATALTLARVGGRVEIRRQLLGGSIVLALGSLGSAAAPSMEWLAVAQVPVGAGIATLTTAGTLAAAEWVPAEQRAATLSWTLIGQPAAWIVGMPLVGVVGEHSWRYAPLVLPLAAAVLAAAAVVRRSAGPPVSRARPPLRAALVAPGIARWLTAELLANTAWAGTLVYAGALFVESYDTSGEVTGGVLAIGAGAHVAGTMSFRRLAGREPRRMLVSLALVFAVAITSFGAFRPSVAVSAMLFSAAAFVAGGRTLLSSAVGLEAPAEVRPAAMAMRAASMQFGYFTGAFLGGTALTVGGYAGLGLTASLLLVGAAAALRVPVPSRLGSCFVGRRVPAVCRT